MLLGVMCPFIALLFWVRRRVERAEIAEAI